MKALESHEIWFGSIESNHRRDDILSSLQLYIIESIPVSLDELYITDDHDKLLPLSSAIPYGGGTIVIALDPTLHTSKGRDSTECNAKYTFNSYIYGRRFIVQPLDVRDTKILYNIHCKQYYDNYMSTNVTSTSNDSEEEEVEIVGRKRSIDMLDRESVHNSNKKDIDTTTSSDTLHDNTEKYEILAAFDVMLPTNATLGRLSEKVADTLGIDSRYILLYLTTNYDEDPVSSAYIEFPICVLHTSTTHTIHRYLHERGYTKKYNTTFRVMYKILPYPVYDVIDVVDERESERVIQTRRELRSDKGWKTVDMVLTDDTLRRVRREYLTRQWYSLIRQQVEKCKSSKKNKPRKIFLPYIDGISCKSSTTSTVSPKTGSSEVDEVTELGGTIAKKMKTSLSTHSLTHSPSIIDLTPFDDHLIVHIDVWNPYHLLDTNTMSIEVNGNTSMDAVTVSDWIEGSVRRYLGITRDDERVPDSVVLSLSGGMLEDIQSMLPRYCEGIGAVCSETLTTVPVDNGTVQGIRVLPTLPLTLCKLHHQNNIIKEMLCSDLSVSHMYSSNQEQLSM